MSANEQSKQNLAARSGRAGHLREAIEQDIVSGHYPPGARLDETELAARHSVSRTPIREALMQLSAMGLVRSIPNKGCFVNEVTMADLIGMFEVMAELEGMCARLAARRMTDESLAVLESLQADCMAACERQAADDYYYANELFHRHLYDASGNKYLAQVAGQLHTRLKPFRRLQLRVPNRLAHSASEHNSVIEALRARDPNRADELMRQHIIVQGDSFSDFLMAISSGPVGSEPVGARLAAR